MNTNTNNHSTKRVIVGLIPAAGRASRIAPLPCSKELYPIGFRKINGNNKLRPKVVSNYILENMRSADITKAFIIIRDGKWDIPSYFRDGRSIDMKLAYLIMDLPYGVPYTLDQAYPYVQDSVIALGFPDMIIQPHDAYTHIIKKLQKSGADAVLGIFPVGNPQKTDMIDLDENGQVLSIQIKPDQTDLIYTWEIAVWNPAFTHFMHDFLLSRKGTSREEVEIFVGDVIQAAINSKLKVDSVIFKDGNYLDIGTPEDLIRAVHIFKEVPGKF